MSVKSSLVYLSDEGYCLHIYTDVSTDKIIMELDHDAGTYGTNLSFILGNYGDKSLTTLLLRMEKLTEPEEDKNK